MYVCYEETCLAAYSGTYGALAVGRRVQSGSVEELTLTCNIEESASGQGQTYGRTTLTFWNTEVRQIHKI